MITYSGWDRTPSDFKRDYVNSVVELVDDEKGDEYLINIVDCVPSSHNRDVVMMSAQIHVDDNTVKNITIDGNRFTMREWFPEAQMYNYKNSVLSFSYMPIRQYCRSYNRHIAKTKHPDVNYYLGYQSGNILSTDTSVTTAIKRNIDIPYEEGIDAILAGDRLAFRLFGYFYCILHPTEKNTPIKIMGGDNYIGFVDAQRKIRLFRGAYFLRDIFRDNNLQERMAS